MALKRSNINRKFHSYYIKNEDGSALIVSLLLLAIMSVLATILMSTATTEIQLSGNYRNTQESFYAADRAIEYSMQSASGGSGEVDLINDVNEEIDPIDPPEHITLIALGQSSLEVPEDPNPDDINTVTYISSGSPPVGSGSDASVFQARNYAINTVGVFPVNTNNPSRTEIRSQFAKIVPK